MNPLILFDYVYYRIAYLYENTFNRITSNEFSGITILSLFQLINGLTLLNLFMPINEIVKEPIIVFVLGYLLIAVLNFIRYKKVINYTELSLNWDKEDRKTRIIKGVCLMCYFLLSIFLYTYFGSVSHRAHLG